MYLLVSGLAANHPPCRRQWTLQFYASEVTADVSGLCTSFWRPDPLSDLSLDALLDRLEKSLVSGLAFEVQNPRQHAFTVAPEGQLTARLYVPLPTGLPRRPPIGPSASPFAKPRPLSFATGSRSLPEPYKPTGSSWSLDPTSPARHEPASPPRRPQNQALRGGHKTKPSAEATRLSSPPEATRPSPSYQRPPAIAPTGLTRNTYYR